MPHGSSRRSLQAMLEEAMQGDRHLESLMLSGKDLPRLPAMDADAVRSDEWLDSLEIVIDMFPEEIYSAGLDADWLSFKIDRLYQRGEVQGLCNDGGDQYHVYVRLDGDHTPAGCSCAQSQGLYPCVHAAAFVEHVRDLLEQKRSPLRRRVDKGRWDKGSPSRDRFRSDLSRQALRQLDRILSSQTGVLGNELAGDATLPEVVTKTAQRLVWRITGDGNEVGIHPVIQQKKKRGDGFTKGKKISLLNLIDRDDLPLTDADRSVIAQIRLTTSGYYYAEPKYRLDVCAAVKSLVGCPHVMLENEPCEVECGPLLLSMLEVESNWKFAFVNDNGDPNINSIVGTADALLLIDKTRACVRYYPCGKQAADVVKQLLGLGPIGSEHMDELLRKVRPLQQRISLRLPEEHFGVVVQEPAKPVILLRSRNDGTLDYGLRVRDAAGALRIPGRDPMIVTTERDGKPVQVQRLPVPEQAAMNRLAEKLGLDVDDTFFGTIHDFDSGLDLIEKLESGEFEIEVLWDKTSEKPVMVLGTLTARNVRVDISSKRNWFGVTGECDFGKQKLSLEDLLFGLSGDSNLDGDYVPLGEGQWAKISGDLRKRLQRLRDATYSDRKTLKLDATAAPAVRELLDTEIVVKTTRNWQACLDRLERAENLQPQVPEGLDAQLRDYQIDGYKWLRRLAEWGVGGILADDMGLGKTIQTLAVLLDRRSQGPALVIAPTSVGFNWEREAERFTPELNAHLYRETERGEFLPSVGPGDLVVCSYGLALRDAAELAKVDWGTLVLDEAQAIKNSRSKTSRAIATFHADWTVALTGTPVENHLGELWSLFHVVSPGVFGGWDQFRRRYATPIEKHGDDESRHALAERLKPFVLRRKKSDVLTELPPRTEMNLYVDLSPAERDEYENVRRVALGELETIESLPNIQDQRFKILALLTRLRQICCHAGLLKENWKGSSAKLDQLCETLESLREEGHRALIFSQFTSYLGLIREQLQQRGFTFEYLDGSTPPAARQQAVDRFQEGNADAFLISLKAGGTGLNLTAADYVIHMDPWWNPAVEDQATDRAHRIGQEKAVMVYRIIARSTIEEEILALHDSKRDLVAGVMQGTEAAGKLSNVDLIRMLRSEP